MLQSLAETQKPVVIVQTPFISGEDLRRLLQVDNNTICGNLRLTLGHGHVMAAIRQQRAIWLMHERTFQQWFRAHGSDILIVDGMEQEMDAISALSFFVAVLHESLSNMQVAIPLTFFCGLHAKPGDYLEGAQGTMRSLIHQLLSLQWDLDQSFLDLPFLDEIRNHSIASLCTLFRNLLTSVPPTTIFCMIDGISEYEISSRIHDVNVMMGFLRDLVDETNKEDSGINFKLLVTSSTASRYARTWFPYEKHIVMPDEAGLDGPLEFSMPSESWSLVAEEYIGR